MDAVAGSVSGGIEMAWPDKDFKYGKWKKAVDNDIKMLRCPDCECQVIRKDYERAIGTKGIRFCPYCGEDMWNEEEDERSKKP